MLREREGDCNGKICAVAQQLRGGIRVEIQEDKGAREASRKDNGVPQA